MSTQFLLKQLLLASCLLFTSVIYSQSRTDNDSVISSISHSSGIKLLSVKKDRMHPASYLLPAALVGYGLTTLGNHELKSINYQTRDELFLESPHRSFHIDNYLQFAPAVMVYGLNFSGIKGKHNFKDRSLIYGISNIILNGAVRAGKQLTRQGRPDGSDFQSFPSGHTAEAFASAEFLRQEYKDVSPWYGYAGYAMAAATGYLRMYNNKHWLSDVAAGAGIGIASTKFAYWVYPKISKAIFKKQASANILMPTYQSGAVGLSFVHNFQ